jgi:septum formation protein
LSKVALAKPLIIATASSIRKEIIFNAGLECEFLPSKVDEDAIKSNNLNIPFLDLAIKLASEKALDISKIKKDFYVLGVDQICQFNDEILSKPGNKENCLKTLKKLSGKNHKQNCGMAIALNNEIIWSESSVASLDMKKFSDEELNDYIDLDEPFNSCGGYKYELNGKNLFNSVEGSIFTIQGLDIDKLMDFLRQNKFLLND